MAWVCPVPNLERLLTEIMDNPIVLHAEMDAEQIGIRNVYRRLKMYYGEELTFAVESEEDCGFVVILEIPLDLE